MLLKGLSTRRVLACLALLLALSAALLVPSDALAAEDEPYHPPWTELLPPLPVGYEPTRENLCIEGQDRCVDVVIREMERRLRPLARDCDHDSVFALIYLRTTEEYRRAIEDPEFFTDKAFVNHQDVVFAAYYFDAFDAYHDGEETPPAWRIAFQAAEDRSVTGMGDLLLGMNAHVNHDLPFVLEAIGLVRPDGSSRKDDHDKVNQFLVRVVEPVLREAADRFDPTIDDGNVPGVTLDETALLQLLVTWREAAWRNAERLALARTDQERELVADSIVAGAATNARALAETFAYRPSLNSTQERDAYCEAQQDPSRD